VKPEASAPDLAQAEKDYELGLQYFRGGGTVLIDHKKSFELIERSAQQGLPEAEAQFAVRLIEGGRFDVSFPPDRAKATEWAGKAIADGLEAKAHRSSHSAEFELANLYLVGLGFSKDETRARLWYESAAMHGEIDAKRALGFLYISGTGVTRDMVKAKGYFEEAAAANIAGAYIFLGLIYKNGTGATKDPAKAFGCFRKAAELGQPGAYANLAELYKEGLGVPQNPAKAVECYQKAVDRGLAVAMNKLAQIYEKGDGVPKDLTKAEELYKKLADRGEKGGKEGVERLRALSAEGRTSPKAIP
jgi:TPR repeat protein